ncbi:MAG: 16S rRNA (cytosine(1402)-N(4))-methyltransferase RsmH [Bryobacterales bacterium]|nr:16S rRNA (cytosine(1402)-N(4))-methyltransferase RsmH [Bryobacterales bacterium]
MRETEHYPVMAAEMESFLLGEGGRPPGAFCDCTVGAGGYARRILRAAPRRRLVAMDRDGDAIERCRRRLSEFGDRVRFVHGSFSTIREATAGCQPLAGIVADLGFSRMQLNEAARGFSLRLRGPLDMRFDRRQSLRAEEFVNRGGERELADLLYGLADERHSRRIARAVVRARPLRDTSHLARVVERAVPRRGRWRIHPATKTFQALRMAVNDEAGELRALLAAAPTILAAGGRLVVISFHSGEDRLVKRSFRDFSAKGVYTPLVRRPLRPTGDEVQRSPASRSARLRAAQRTNRPIGGEQRSFNKLRRSAAW